MIKMAPTLIEFGDGDTGYKMGITDEDYGLVTLYNTEPGEIGRPGEEEPPVERIGAYILFKNVKSLDCIIEGLTKMRDAMVEEGTEEDKSRPFKRAWTCEKCKWHSIHECGRMDSCDNCPNYNDDEHCKCTTVACGEPCPYYEEWEEPSDE